MYNQQSSNIISIISGVPLVISVPHSEREFVAFFFPSLPQLTDMELRQLSGSLIDEELDFAIFLSLQQLNKDNKTNNNFGGNINNGIEFDSYSEDQDDYIFDERFEEESDEDESEVDGEGEGKGEGYSDEEEDD